MITVTIMAEVASTESKNEQLSLPLLESSLPGISHQFFQAILHSLIGAY